MPRRPVLVTLVAAGALVAGLVTGPAALAAGPTPQLLGTHVFYPAGSAAHGKPQPATANCSPDGATQGQYALTGWKDTARAATLVTSTIPTTIKTGTDPSKARTGTASSSAVQGALQDAFHAWSRADSRAPSITVSADSSSTQKRPSADRTDELLFARVSRNAIAITYTWRWSDGLMESDTVFSSTLAWAIIPDTDPTAGGCYPSWPWYDVADIATHEFGHTYGLDDLRTDRFETMYGYGYTGETLKRSLADGDTTGLDSIY